MSEITRKISEDSKQYEIRSELETNVEKKALDLFQDLFALNIIHNDAVFGDNRKKKNIKLEKALKKYLNL